MKVSMRFSVGLALLMTTAMVPATMASLPPPVPECMNFKDDDGDTGTDWFGVNKTDPAIFVGPDPDCAHPLDNSEKSTNCKDGHFSPHSHTYGLGGSVGAKSDAATGGNETGAGVVTVTDNNVADCDGDGSPGDFDGDYETGVGGGFFGFGQWAKEPICKYNLQTHGATVVVNDVVWGDQIAFVIGADQTAGPTISVDPVTSETSCSTDGVIEPCDPVDPSPTCGASDCLTDVFVGTGTTCGAGGDGGYWVFLNGALVSEGIGGVGVSNAPTAGTITA